MNGELRKIKRKYGENMARLCRSLFPTILENPGLLYDLLVSHFDTSRCLYDDIIDGGLINSFRGYMYSLAGIKDDIIEQSAGVIKTPTELLDDAGYILYECHNLDELNEFKKFYAKGEELCTFKDGQDRLDRCFVFFAVKKDVDNIKSINKIGSILTGVNRIPVYGNIILCGLDLNSFKYKGLGISSYNGIQKWYENKRISLR